jgi:RimJ/RimL family protein N-acetyltransferase
VRLVTERLELRHWRVEDAQDLYQAARNPHIGPMAGWNPHQSVQESEEIIRTVLSKPETWAVTLKGCGALIGCASIMTLPEGSAPMGPGEGEIGYWISEPYWNVGFATEVACALIRRAFVDLGYSGLWCVCLAENAPSRRVQEKCGFLFHHAREVVRPIIGDTRVDRFSYLSAEDWKQQSVF